MALLGIVGRVLQLTLCYCKYIIDNMITYMLEGSGFGSWILGPKKSESKS